MKHLFLIILIFLLLVSCAVKKSRFAADNIVLGTEKSEIISKYGKPFTSEILLNSEKKQIEVFCYKELVYVSYETYVLNTCFYFENNKLVELKQQTEVPPSKVKVLESH